MMFNFLKGLFSSKSEEEFTPVIVERLIPTKDIWQIRSEFYGQIAQVLEEYAVYSSRSKDETYTRLKRSMQKINELIDKNKDSLADKREINALNERISSYKDDRSLSMVTYDICRVISGGRYDTSSVVMDSTVKRIMYWYGLY